MIHWYRCVALFALSLFASSGFAAFDDLLPLTGARDDVLIVVNDNSLDSCEVGRYYAERTIDASTSPCPRTQGQAVP